ncbi:MAG: hypothetical protein Q8S44_07580 [Flavobacteriaceae bacterium]|nr:hypothetical protein [Flavobacteriaceae bacterium]
MQSSQVCPYTSLYAGWFIVVITVVTVVTVYTVYTVFTVFTLQNLYTKPTINYLGDIMTDTGAVIRAIKMGFEDSVICDTLNITKPTLDLIKIDYGNLRDNFDQGRSSKDTASLLLKEPAEVWYAFHVFENDNKTLEQEILDENEGKPRPKPPPFVKQKQKAEQDGESKVNQPEPKETKTGGKGNRKKTPSKEKIDEALTKEAEAATGAVLMEDAGRIGEEISRKRQEIGKYVMETMDLAARQTGYPELKTFLEFIYNHFINNYGKNEQKDRQIQDLNDANQLLIDALAERNRRAFIARQIDMHVLEIMDRGHPVASGNLLEYARFLEEYYKPVNTDLLVNSKGDEQIYDAARCQ